VVGLATPTTGSTLGREGKSARRALRDGDKAAGLGVNNQARHYEEPSCRPIPDP
jgi:hypothetical protein